MSDTGSGDFLSRMKGLILGKAKDIRDPGIFHKLSLIAFFAWVGLGADGLSSANYGPEESFLSLGANGHLGIFVALATAITVIVIASSYSQIVELFPGGGGGYLVASKLLTPTLGMISGCALLIDYVLTITLSIASGADAIFSFLPIPMLRYKLLVAVLGVLLLMVMNLRGVRESVMPLVPIFLLFLVTHTFAILYALLTHLALHGRRRPDHGCSNAGRAAGPRGLRRVPAPDARIQHGSRDVHRDRGGQQRPPHPARAEGADGKEDHALHGCLPGVHGRRAHDRLPPVRRLAKLRARR